MLTQVQHQEVHLVVNPAKGTLRGWTIITAAHPEAGQTSLGLQTLDQDITSVTVNGLTAEYTLIPPPPPGLGEATADTAVKDVAEHAYSDHLSAAQYELLLNLVIQLPQGWDSTQSSQQQPAETAAGGMAVDGPSTAAAVKSEANGAADGVAPGSAQEAVAAGSDSAAPPQTQATGGTQALANGDAVAVKQEPSTAEGGAVGKVKGANKAAGDKADIKTEAATPPQPSLLIRIAFTAKLNATHSSAIMLLPADDRLPSCEVPGPDGPGARYLVANTQRHRARALFPCADVPGYVATYDIHITVPPNHLAVCDGLLRNQLVSQLCLQDGTQVPHSRTFVFTTEKPVSISSVLLATGPMAAWPLLPPARTTAGAATAPTGKGSKGQEAKAAAQDNPLCTITCFGPPDMKEAVLHTSRALHLIIKVYEKHLACRFPFSQLYLVYLPAAAFRSQDPPVAVGSNIILLSSQLLVGPDAGEPTIESTLALAGAVARCIFGGLLLPLVAEDAWVLDGLAVYLSEVWLVQWLGKNELAWRRHKERQALAQADNGGAPPLCSRTLQRTGISNPSTTAAAGGNPSPATLPGNRLLQQLQAFGSPFGTELLEPGHLRCWKAAAVIRMFELRAGRDEFKRTLGHIVHRAISNANQSRQRHIATDKFLKLMQKASGIKGIEAFAQRWIYGRGCPEFEVGFAYKKNNILEVAVRQGGSAASRRTALLAARAAKTNGAEDDAQTHLKIAVHEAEAQSELTLKVTAQDTLLLGGVELQTKVAGKRQGARKGRAQQQEAIKDEEGEEGGITGSRQPPVWLRFDPNGEWLCRAKVFQPDYCWVAQLEKSRDVAAQSLAVAGLANLALMSQLVAPALSACLRASNVYCRVRAEAALALGLVAGAEVAQQALCSYLHEALYDPTTLSLKPNSFGDLSEHEVLRALPVAIGLMRGEGDKSPVEAIDTLLGFLENSDNTGNPYSDAWYVARFVEGLGHMQPVNAYQLRRIVSALDRQLALEDLHPSPHYVVGDACLTALSRLACQLTAADVLEEVKQLLHRFTSTDAPLALRHSAARNLMQVEATCAFTEKADVLLHCLLALLSLEGWGAAGRAALIADAFAIMGEMLADDPVIEGTDEVRMREIEEERQVSVPQLLKLYHLMHETHDARTRQYIFMLVQRLAQKDPTLYREREEEVIEATAAAQPEVTVRSGGAAPTAPAVTAGRTAGAPAASGGTTGVTAAGGGGTAAAAQAAGGTKIKLKLTAAHSLAVTGGAAPTASGGTVGPTTSGLAGQAVSQGMPPPASPAVSQQHPSMSAGGRVASMARSSLHTIPEADIKQESGQPASGRTVDDEVVQPVRTGGVTAAVASVKPELSSGMAAVGPRPTSSTGTVARDVSLADTAAVGPPRSPPRDPRARMPVAASVPSTPVESVGGHSGRSHAAAGTPPSVAMSRLARTTVSPRTSAGGAAVPTTDTAADGAAAAAAVPAVGLASGAGKLSAAGIRDASPAPLQPRLSFDGAQAPPDNETKEEGEVGELSPEPVQTGRASTASPAPELTTAAAAAGVAGNVGEKPAAPAALAQGPAAATAAAAAAAAGAPSAAKPLSRRFGDSKYRRSVSGATGGAGSSGGADSKSVSPPDASSAGTAAAAAAMAARSEQGTPSRAAAAAPPGASAAAAARPPRQPSALGQRGVKPVPGSAGADIGGLQQPGIVAGGAAAAGAAASKGMKRARDSISPPPQQPSTNTAPTAQAGEGAPPPAKVGLKLKVRHPSTAVPAVPQGPPAPAPAPSQLQPSVPASASSQQMSAATVLHSQPAMAASASTAPAAPPKIRLKFGGRSSGGGAPPQQPAASAGDISTQQPQPPQHYQHQYPQQPQQQPQPSYQPYPAQPVSSAAVMPPAPRVSSGGGAAPSASGVTKLKISVKGLRAAAGAPSPSADTAASQPPPKKPRQQ